MEKQLSEYRLRKAREKTSLDQAESTLSVFKRFFRRESKEVNPKEENQISNGSHLSSHPSHSSEAYYTSSPSNGFSLPQTALKIILWLLLWGLFIEFGFGAVYLIVSSLFMIYFSMRTGHSRTRGAPSAYSVFNPNCERIDGTFTTEQFEKELRHGAGSVQ